MHIVLNLRVSDSHSANQESTKANLCANEPHTILCCAVGPHPHEKNLLLRVEGMTLCKQSQLGSCPGVHLSAQQQLLLPQLQPHTQVVQVGVGLLRHL